MTMQNITTESLLYAYSHGYFPMWNQYDNTMEWHNPNPRAIFMLNSIKVSKSLRQSLRRNSFFYTVDSAFSEVIHACAERPDCWINEEIIEQYSLLHEMGHAHSFEVWNNDTLVGGLYGVAVGGAFCGESMFSKQTDASKCAFIYSCIFLSLCHFHFIDSQYLNHHTQSLGAFDIEREQYFTLLEQAKSAGKLFQKDIAMCISHPLDYIPLITGDIQ
ncbi:MAG TPA: leucyl/phenylalanyl-tRNA--protein transferase [Candidatus Kapabacteria bacterium]|nr:leucyl/phenylalanyl-tRNA--protein transferase [Candidatus Kapabacteria bacterium]